jgi:hypothetical protein
MADHSRILFFNQSGIKAKTWKESTVNTTLADAAMSVQTDGAIALFVGIVSQSEVGQGKARGEVTFFALFLLCPILLKDRHTCIRTVIESLLGGIPDSLSRLKRWSSLLLRRRICISYYSLVLNC